MIMKEFPVRASLDEICERVCRIIARKTPVFSLEDSYYSLEQCGFASFQTEREKYSNRGKIND